MDDGAFMKAAFFAVALIAFIGAVSMYFMQQTGAFGSWSSMYAPTGSCCCHNGAYAYPSGFFVSCISGIVGPDVSCKGMATLAACMEMCGQRTYWWCSN